jgi:hypothetical protein
MDSFEGKWAALSEEVLSGVRDWGAQHPRATLREVETEVDSRLAGMRARLVEEVALQSRAAAWSVRAGAERAPLCPDCGGALQPRGKRARRLKAHGGQEVTLQREYGVCLTCGRGHFPPG